MATIKMTARQLAELTEKSPKITFSVTGTTYGEPFQPKEATFEFDRRPSGRIRRSNVRVTFADGKVGMFADFVVFLVAD